MTQTTLSYISVILSAVCVLLLILVLRKKGSGDNDKLEEVLYAVDSLSREIKSQSGEILRMIEYSTTLEERRSEATKKYISDAFNHIFELLRNIGKENSDGRSEMLKTTSEELEKIRKANIEQSERQLRLLTLSIEKLQESNEKRLEQMRKTVDEKLDETLTTRLDATFKTVSEQLQNVYKSLGEMKELSSGVTTNVTSLSRILTNVKARGTWAEIQLEGILDQTIPGMYDKNVRTDKSSREVVEFAVRIPSGEDRTQFTYLPIDSKFPVEDYIRLCTAADNADSQGVIEARKALERRVLTAAKDITKYIHEPDTTPFAIMYLATEGLYSEIISSQNSIAEKLHNEYNVMVAGPSTITALLNSLSMGFRAIQINERAKEVRETLAAVKVQYDKFGAILVKAKSKISEAGKTLEEAQHRNEMINKKLRNVGDVSLNADEILGITDGEINNDD